MFSEAEFFALQRTNTPTQSSSSTSNTASSVSASETVVNKPVLPACHPMITKSQAGIRKPNPNYALLNHRVACRPPTTVAAAAKYPRWNNAMDEEIGNCKETKTWSLVPRTPEMHVLGNKWIYRTKLNADGSPASCKARLVVQGNNQEDVLTIWRLIAQS